MKSSANQVSSDRLIRYVPLLIFIAAGVAASLTNLRLPIVRNALCYAKAALGIVEHHFNLFAIAHDRAWTSGKPILFSLVAAPFVSLFNANTGTIVASAIGTAFFLWMVVLALARLNRRNGLDPSFVSLAFVLVAFNPLVLYQFWSAYPDSLFAGLVVLTFILIDVIATESKRDTRWHILALGATIYLAIHTKLYGAILGPICFLYLAMHGRQFVTGSVYLRSKVSILLVVFTSLVLVLLAAALKINPLLDFADGAGFDSYMNGIVDAKGSDVIGSLSILGFCALLTFQVALLFLATGAAWRALAPAPLVFAAVYLLGLLTFPATDYNMRYFLPVFPFIAVSLTVGARSTEPTARRAILGGYAGLALILVLAFNSMSVGSRLQPVLSEFATTWAWLDNLRLAEHMRLKEQIDEVNATIPSGSVLYWSSDYYGSATHGLAEHLGIRKDLDIRYVRRTTDIGVSPKPVFLMEYPRDWEQPPKTPNWAARHSVGRGLFRLDPLSVDGAKP